MIERRSMGRGNSVSSESGRTYEQIVRANLFSYFNRILWGVGLILTALGQYNDAFITVIVGLINALISMAQEVRAKRQLEQIAVLLRSEDTQEVINSLAMSNGGHNNGSVKAQ